jgi:hypothetical protein
MTRISLIFLLSLCCQWMACRPEANRQAQEKNAPPAPADHTAVARDTSSQASAARPPVGSGALRIAPGQVGPIKIGMPVARLRQVLPAGQVREVAITREGQGNKAYQIGGEEGGVLVEEKCAPACQVWRVQVKDPAYRTAENLGIGSTLGEVKKHYPISYLGAGETEIVAVSAQKKITFMLDVSQLPAQNVPRLNLQNTPDSVKVLGMLVL